MLMQCKEQKKRLLIEPLAASSSAKVNSITDHIQILVAEAALVLLVYFESEKLSLRWEGDPPRGFDLPIIPLLVSKLQGFTRVTAADEKKRLTLGHNVGNELKYNMLKCVKKKKK